MSGTSDVFTAFVFVLLVAGIQNIQKRGGLASHDIRCFIKIRRVSRMCSGCDGLKKLCTS